MRVLMGMNMRFAKTIQSVCKENQQPIRGQRDWHKNAAGIKTPKRTKQG